MACKIALFTTALFLVVAVSFAAPAEEKPGQRLDVQAGKDDLAAGDKEDLKTAASHWGGWGGYGGWGGHYGGHYPQYWGYPSYSYGYGGYGWPYGGYYGGYGGYGGFGHHGYWW